MRHVLLSIMLLSTLANARLTTFTGTQPLRSMHQGVTVFAQKDIDHDGDVDWVTEDWPNKVSIVLNDRYGKTTVLTRAVSLLTINSIDIGNADNDSIGDILIAGEQGTSGSNTFPADLSVIYSGANRLYEDSVDIPVEADVPCARFMDVNGDGHNEVLAVIGSRQSILRWYEKGTSGWKKHDIDTSIGDLSSSRSWIATADLNGDKKMDFILGNDCITQYSNNGNGTFTPKTIDDDAHATCGALADIDLDGDLDIITGKLIYYRNGDTYTKDTISDPPTNEADAIAVNDVNGDGYPDIAASVWEEGVYLWQSTPDKKFDRSTVASLGDPKSIAIGDVNFDRFNDVIYIAQKAGTLSHVLNTGSFAFERKTLFKYDRVAGLKTIEMGNGRRPVFLLYRNLGGSPAFSLYEDAGNITYKSSFAASRLGDDFIYGVETADFNNDGFFDIVVTGSKTASWYEQTEPLKFTEHRIGSMDVRLKPLQVVDLNGDKNMDVAGVFTTFQKDVFLMGYRNDGTGKFTEDTLCTFPKISGNYSTTFYFTDANGDGTAERHSSDCMDCRFLPFDVNHDGNQDLLIPHSDTSWFTVDENTGIADTAGHRTFITHRLKPGIGEMACADLDNDGRDDMIMLDISSKSLTWMPQDTLFGLHSLNTVAPNNCASGLSCVDLDNDGWKDIVCADTNDNIVWFRNLLGAGKATVEVPTAAPPISAMSTHEAVTPRPIGNGRWEWRFGDNINQPKLRFFLINGVVVDIPLTVTKENCIVDIGHFRGARQGVILWKLLGKSGTVHGSGMFSGAWSR